jgi:hypothetical protein
MPCCGVQNRVLALELQGLVERWRAMDVEEMAQQNHELREECLRLQQENMQLSRWDGSCSSCRRARMAAAPPPVSQAQPSARAPC